MQYIKIYLNVIHEINDLHVKASHLYILHEALMPYMKYTGMKHGSHPHEL